ncbi:MAG: Hint domain-containing protein [Pseudomonadota bacterium]
MTQGIHGTFVIAWSQVLVDGLPGVQPEDLEKGATWCWRGEPVRIDGPSGVLLLGQAKGQQDMQARAAKVVKKLVGASLQNRPFEDVEVGTDVPDHTVILTDGRHTYTMTLIDVPGSFPLAMFINELPLQGQDLWVVDRDLQKMQMTDQAPPSGIICFSGETQIATPHGHTSVDALKPGDVVLTRDNGPQPVLWVGNRRVTGARMHVMPHMRPVRIRANALHMGSPTGDMLVSPNHRMLVTGRIAEDLFNSAEVLAAAKDLVNGRSIHFESRVQSTTYYHILLERHEILNAGGMWSESFHPAYMDLETLLPHQKEQLLAACPNLRHDPLDYGPNARRSLQNSEAALLQYAS